LNAKREKGAERFSRTPRSLALWIRMPQITEGSRNHDILVTNVQAVRLREESEAVRRSNEQLSQQGDSLRSYELKPSPSSRLEADRHDLNLLETLCLG
jgi:hypothetical protein